MRPFDRTLAARCERLVDRLIGESTAAQRAAQRLEGKSMAVEILGLGIVLRCTVDDGAFGLALGTDEPADVRLHAAPLELLALARAGSSDELKARRVRLDGDVHVAEAFAELARFARPDVEDELAAWIGDVAAHEIAEAGRGMRGFVARAHRALELDTAEYLQEEQRVLPGRLEVDAFCGDVDRIRDDVERAATRLERLAAALGSRSR